MGGMCPAAAAEGAAAQNVEAQRPNGGMATEHVGDAMFIEGCPGTANALEAGSCFELRRRPSASLTLALARC
jgi:hypothetical protein